ncbi:molecular chaperone DjiA [Alterinioella nitratireducens]|uniref:molecular chaperone DjiA n=1 Tax=Alterinioella nitratireducens TaxID=2735915 RepID=UPI001557D1BB|nr:molecular chaperone DjiA [Alterinioella nitratireducens]NPD20514.1 molecular chaperone DjiA [Alterinioella nitratireducens]
MSLWTRITEALSALASGEGLGAMFDKLRKPPELTVGFAIAVIALGAKMAKADGRVTRNEVTAFREVFAIPQADEKSAARVFNLAREDVAGFEDYARKIAAMFHSDSAVLSDLMDGLFHIAVADGTYHPNEDLFLARVAEIFGMTKREFAALRARNVPDARPDPYTVLGVDSSMSLEDIRKVWRGLVRDTHPDRMMARGVPEEAIKLAQSRLIAINNAWEEIQTHHGG